MATIAHIASELQTARESIADSLKKLAERNGVALPEQERARDKAVDQMFELQWVAESLRIMADNVPAQPVDLQPESAESDPIVKGTGKPLSYFEGKSDEEILTDPDAPVGEARLKEIHKARKSRAK